MNKDKINKDQSVSTMIDNLNGNANCFIDLMNYLIKYESKPVHDLISFLYLNVVKLFFITENDEIAIKDIDQIYSSLENSTIVVKRYKNLYLALIVI